MSKQSSSKDRPVTGLSWDKPMTRNGVSLHASPDQRSHLVGHSALALPLFAGNAGSRLFKAVSALIAIAILFLSFKRCSLNDALEHRLSFPSLHYARAAATSLLEVFQVYPPVLAVTPEDVLEITDGSSNASVQIVDSNRPVCRQELAVHSFAFSYGKPFVGHYEPPSCAFNRVTWNLTVVSAGRQFDRLGIVYLGDTEVFRTSTAEPTEDGIAWTYLKDMTSFLPLFRSDQKIIFDLGNLINDVYTAAFNVTLTASYFTSDDTIAPADMIIPVSAHNASQNLPSVFMTPPMAASNSIMLPRNVKRAVFTIAATGQSEEEFWWSNVPQPYIDTFPQYGELYGFSPFREVQLLIDDRLAGVVWPFPVLFTGGVVPGLWRPIVGIDAFDLKEGEIDITPWLPLLCDGNEHTFEIQVSGLNNSQDGTAVLSQITGSYWLVTGKIFVWLDEDDHITTGNGPHQSDSDHRFHITSSVLRSANGTNETLLYQATARRKLSFQSNIELSTGTEVAAWQQSLSFSNTGTFSDQGNVEVNNQYTSGIEISSSGYARQFDYPLYAYSEYTTEDDNITIIGDVEYGKDVKIVGRPVFPTGLEPFADCKDVHDDYGSFQGAWLTTTLTGNATYLANETESTSFSFGQTEQNMVFRGIQAQLSHAGQDFPILSGSEELFTRYVTAVNGSVVEDEETLIDKPIGHSHGASRLEHSKGYALSSIPGRGGNEANALKPQNSSHWGKSPLSGRQSIRRSHVISD